MTLGTSVAPRPRNHIVEFYDDEPALIAHGRDFLADALTGGGAAVAFATPDHLDAFAAGLDEAGHDTAAARAGGRLLLLDAAGFARQFSRAGGVSARTFDDIVGPILARVGAGTRPLHIYGEIVAVMCQDGDITAAMRLEDCWNALGHRRSFSLLCGYPVATLHRADTAAALAYVCDAHSGVVGAECDPPAPSVEAATVAQLSRTFPAVARSVGAARRFVADSLSRLDWRDGLDDARLLVSELATNAVVHAHTEFTVVVARVGAVVRISVRDEHPTPPALHGRGRLAESGRGLGIVAALTRRWGHHPTAGGKVVWGELSTTRTGGSRPA